MDAKKLTLSKKTIRNLGVRSGLNTGSTDGQVSGSGGGGDPKPRITYTGSCTSTVTTANTTNSGQSYIPGTQGATNSC